MLNDEKRKLIEDNMGLVYSYVNKHDIKDEDEQADYICEFCHIIDTCDYDESRGKLSTLVWRSLDNYTLQRMRNKTRIKRTLDEQTIMPSLDQEWVGINSKCPMTLGEVIPDDHDCFGDIELARGVEIVKDILKNRDESCNVAVRSISQEAMFKDIIYAYLHENGRVNGRELAEKYGISRQAINNYMKRFRKLAEEYIL